MTKISGCLGVAALLAGAALGLSACDGGSASTAARDHSQAQAAPATTVADASGGGSGSVLNDRPSYQRDDAQREPVALVMGKPMWAANRSHTAEENAQYQFNRDGADFGARTLDDFVAKAHAFTAHPPSDVETLTRSNGDKLLYDPGANVFAVVDKDGAPRTMFKPSQGKSYWDEQVQRQNEGDDGRSASRRSYGDRSYGGSASGGRDSGGGSEGDNQG